MAKSNANTSASAIQPAIELDSFVSLRDLGYKQARASGILDSQARYAIANIKGFPDDIDDESKTELKSGYQLRYSELYPNVEYAIIDGNYLPVAELSKESQDAKLEKVTIGIDYIMSFSTQAWGALRTSKDGQQVKLWTAFNPRRVKFINYANNRIGELQKRAKMLIAEQSGQQRQRTATKAFGEVVTNSFDDLKKRCKTAHLQRGDVTANTKLLDEAIAAFNAVWLKG
jgi:flagellar hook-basal body complex protein FliE